MYSQIRLLLVTLALVSANLNAEELSIPFIVEDACPFEGCTFGEWDVLRETNVYQRPDENSTITGKLSAGTKANIVTGTSYIIPGEAIIIGEPYSHAEIMAPNKKVYILNYLGEGYSQVFLDGQFIDTKIAREKNRCSDNPNWRYCWVRVIREPVTKWWVKVKDSGWVLMKDNPLKPIDAFSQKMPHNKRMQPDFGELTLASAVDTRRYA